MCKAVLCASLVNRKGCKTFAYTAMWGMRLHCIWSLYPSVNCPLPSIAASVAVLTDGNMALLPTMLSLLLVLVVARPRACSLESALLRSPRIWQNFHPSHTKSAPCTPFTYLQTPTHKPPHAQPNSYTHSPRGRWCAPGRIQPASRRS